MNRLSTISLVAFLYALLAVLAIGANPFMDQTSAPMGLLLSQPGWSSVENAPAVVHHERSDVLDVFLPQWITLKRQIRAGDSGIWLPTSSGGKPGVIELSTGVLTPSFFVFLAFEDDWLGFYFSGVIKLLIGGLGGFLFLRLFLGAPAAFFGGAAFSLMGFHAAWFFWPHVSTSVWIPWVLWSAAGWHFSFKARWLPRLIASVSLLILGGFPVVSAYGLYTFSLLVLLLQVFYRNNPRKILLSLSLLLLSVVIAFLICAIPLLGLYEYLSIFDLEHRLGTTLVTIRNDWNTFFEAYRHGLPTVEKTFYIGKISTGLAILGTLHFFSPRNWIGKSGCCFIFLFYFLSSLLSSVLVYFLTS